MTDSLFTRLRLLKRLPVILLAVGPALLYFGWVAPRASRDHPVVLRFQQPLHDVRRVTASWTNTKGNGETLAGSTFDLRSTPDARELRTTVHVPDGDLWLDLDLERADGTQSVRRKIQLGDGETTIILSVSPPAGP